MGLGGAGRQNFNLLNMVMWHIKLKGMISRTGYTDFFYIRIKLVTFGWGQNVGFFMSEQLFFQIWWDGSSWVEPVLSKDKCVLF